MFRPMEVNMEAGGVVIEEEVDHHPVELAVMNVLLREVQDVQLDQHLREDVQVEVNNDLTQEEVVVDKETESYLVVSSPKVI